MSHRPKLEALSPSFQNIQNEQSLLNTPLNLSVANVNIAVPSSTADNVAPHQLPQLILTSGQLIQGIQGAQLLIPSGQGKFIE